MRAGGDRRLRVVLADDSGIFREGLRLLLEAAGIEVGASSADVPGLVAAVDRCSPDAAVIDVRMPPTHRDEGLHAALALRAANPSLGLLMLSTYAETRLVTDLLDSVPTGVGYLLKDRVEDAAMLVDALWRVARGGIALDPEVVKQLLSRRRDGPVEGLGDRERDVLGLLAEGRSNAGIARSLFVSVKTVEAHVASIFRALGLQDDADDNRRVLAALTYFRSREP